MHREHSPGLHSSRSHRHRSSSPSRLWSKEDARKVKDKRSERGGSREPKDYTRKRKLKSSRDGTIKEQYSDTDEKARKSKSKKKRLSSEHHIGKEQASHGSHDSDGLAGRKHHSKDGKSKSESSKREYKSETAEKQEQEPKNDRQGRARMATGEDATDTEHIKTLSVKREPSYVQNDETYTRKRDLIQIVTESFEDTNVEEPPTLAATVTEDSVSKTQPEVVIAEKTEDTLPSNSEETKIKQIPEEKPDEPTKEQSVEMKTEVKAKAELKPEKKSTAGKEREIPAVPKVEDSSPLVVKKVKDGTKIKVKKSKDKEKSEKLEKIERLQAEIRRLERQQEESLMVAPPELSRWERDDSGHESDGKEHLKSRVSSSISKPSLPK